MHYRNGREAKKGDTVLALQQYGTPFVGVITSISPGSTTCNANAIALPNGPGMSCLTLGDCVHIDDVAAAFPVKAKEVPAPEAAEQRDTAAAPVPAGDAD